MFNTKTKLNNVGYKKYQELTDDEIITEYNEIIQYWESFLTQNDPTLRVDVDYFVHKKNMFEIIRRCHKRCVYYYVFHDLKELCEYKEVALLCFWINTLKPFMVINPKANVYNCPNEMFSLYLILSVINGIYNTKFGKDIEYPSDKRIQDIVYDFKYCSISREAMIAYVETLADIYGVGIEYIFRHAEND